MIAVAAAIACTRPSTRFAGTCALKSCRAHASICDLSKAPRSFSVSLPMPWIIASAALSPFARVDSHDLSAPRCSTSCTASLAPSRIAFPTTEATVLSRSSAIAAPAA